MEKEREELEQQKFLAEKRRLEFEAMRRLTPAERVQKTALNTGIRFDLTDPRNTNTSAYSFIEEIRKKGTGPDE